MLHRARVFMLDDDPLWINTLTEILEPQVGYLRAATSLEEARNTLQKNYFNVAFVDLSLEYQNNTDTQGWQFLEYLSEYGFDDAISTIVLSAYGNVASVNTTHTKYKVTNFLDKAEFSANSLLDSVRQALQQNALATEPAIQISRGRKIPDLWQRFNWPTREDEAQLTHELTDLLIRLFPRAVHLFIDDMSTGQSGAGVLRVTPTYDKGVGTTVVVKFGKQNTINREHQNYENHVRSFMGTFSSTQFTAVRGRAVGAISYSFIGTNLNDVKSFEKFYLNHDVPAITVALDNLFRSTCAWWYDNHEQNRLFQNLVQLYTKGLNIKWDAVWEQAATCDLDLTQNRLTFPGIDAEFRNPRKWLESYNYEIYMQVWRSVTHGDLNQNNILVTADGRCWLIDFYRTGMGHILRDVVELETAIKFGICSFASPAEYREFEQLLLQQEWMDEPVSVDLDHRFYKPLAVIGHLRKIADLFTGAAKEMNEYEVGLLLTTLNLCGIKFYESRLEQIVLSAAMLCDKLEETLPGPP